MYIDITYDSSLIFLPEIVVVDYNAQLFVVLVSVLFLWHVQHEIFDSHAETRSAAMFNKPTRVSEETNFKMSYSLE